MRSYNCNFACLFDIFSFIQGTNISSVCWFAIFKELWMYVCIFYIQFKLNHERFLLVNSLDKLSKKGGKGRASIFWFVNLKSIISTHPLSFHQFWATIWSSYQFAIHYGIMGTYYFLVFIWGTTIQMFFGL